jgi:hypothetical protein
MSRSISNLLEFLEEAFVANRASWEGNEIDEATVRAVARQCTRRAQQTLVIQLDALLVGSSSDTDLLNVASKARVDHLVDKSTVRDWFVMIRDQLQIVIVASD